MAAAMAARRVDAEEGEVQAVQEADVVDVGAEVVQAAPAPIMTAATMTVTIWALAGARDEEEAREVEGELREARIPDEEEEQLLLHTTLPLMVVPMRSTGTR